MLTKIIALLTIAAFPLLASAQQDVDSVIELFLGWIDSAVGLLIALAVLIFIYGVIKYMLAGGDEEAVKTGRKYILWGVIGIAVIVSVWGLVNFLTYSLDLDTDRPEVPDTSFGA